MIDAVGHYAPPNIITNFDLERKVQTSDEWIRTRSGIRQRHIASEHEAASDLALRAVEQAIKNSNTTKIKDIEMIIVGTVTADHLFPSTACILQKKLGLKDIPAFDLSAGCSGFLYALDMAKQYLENGIYKTILVVGVEVLSRVLNWEDRTTCVLFGDGSGAAIVKRAPHNCISRVIASTITADASEWELLTQKAGGSRLPASRDTIQQNLHTVWMEGNKIFKLAVKAMSTITAELLKKNDLSVKDLDWIIPHQANIRIIEAVAEKLNIPMNRVVVTIDRYANTSAASIPTALSYAVQNNIIKRGDLVGLTAFGAGLTFGSCIIRY